MASAADDTLRAIAAYAKVATFPWAELEAQGKGLLQSNAYVDVLEQRFNQYFQVVWQLDIPELQFGGVSADAARGAVDDLRDAIVSRSGGVFAALIKNQPMLALTDSIAIPGDVLRMMLIVTNAVTWADFSGHDSGAWAWSAANGRVSVDEAKDSAQSCYRLWTIVIDLDKAGLLDAFKKPAFKKPVSGLGAAPLAPAALIAIVVVAVAVVAVIAWLIVTLKVEANRQSIIEKSCFDEKGKLLSPAPPHCTKYLDNIAQDPNAHLTAAFAPVIAALTAGVKGFFGVLGVGVLIYIGGVYVLPAVLAATRKSSASRAPAQLVAKGSK